MNLPLRNARMKLSQGQLFWHEVGRGPTLVFLHGSWQDSSQWLPVLEQLSPQFHCLAPDLLGFGTSEHPRLHYSVDVQVECLAEYLDTLRLRQVYLVGHSLGGWIAASFALKYPDQVQGLILLQPEGVAVPTLGRRWFGRWLLISQPVLVGILRSLHPLAKLLGKTAPVQRLLDLHQQLRRSRTACQILFQRRQAEVKAELLQERLPWLKTPVLLLQEANASPEAITLTQTYAQHLLDAKVAVLPTQDGSVEAIAQAIRTFHQTSSAPTRPSEGSDSLE